MFVKARISLHSVSNGLTKDFLETSTSPVGNRTEIERLKSILAEKLTLTDEAAILKEKLKENKQKTENAKVLCSNSNYAKHSMQIRQNKIKRAYKLFSKILKLLKLQYIRLLNGMFTKQQILDSFYTLWLMIQSIDTSFNSNCIIPTATAFASQQVTLC